MRKIWVIGGAVALLAGGCAGATGASDKPSKGAASQPNTGPAQIACAQPVFDFGKVAQGADVKHVFVLRNNGGAPLTIERAAGG